MTFVLYVVLVLTLLACSSQAKELSFKSEDKDDNRELTIKPWSLGLWTGVYYHSVEVNDEGKPKRNGDYIWGSIYVGTASYPTNWQGYFSASNLSNRTIHDPDKIDWRNFNTSWTSSYIASAYLRIIEKDSKGKQVACENLNGIWTYDKNISKSLTNQTAGLYANVFSSVLSNRATIMLTYISTTHSGVLNTLGVRVVPKGVETLVRITQWPYMNEDNTLTLVVASGSRDVSGSTNGLVSTGADGENATFFHISNSVRGDENITKQVRGISMNITKDLEGTFGYLSNIPKQLRAKYFKHATCGIFGIEFPAGAKSILYDPNMGSGPDPFYVAGGSNTNLIIVVTLGCFFAAVILAESAWEFFGKRRVAYQQVE